MWYTGQKVVCVKDFPLGGYGDEIAPTLGQHYTLRDVHASFYGNDDDPVVRVFEIKNPIKMYTIGDGGKIGPDEIWFTTRRFRPLCSRPTYIGELRKLLVPVYA